MKLFGGDSDPIPPPDHQNRPDCAEASELVDLEPGCQRPMTAQAQAPGQPPRWQDRIHCIHCGPLSSCNGCDCGFPRPTMRWASAHENEICLVFAILVIGSIPFIILIDLAVKNR